MPLLQQLSRKTRSVLGHCSRLADAARPTYGRALRALYGRRGMPWSINGQPFRIDPAYRQQLACDYDKEVAAALSRRVLPGSICFDVGANVGVYALQFAGWTGADGRVFAFEPNPDTRAVLTRHIEMNALSGRVEVVPLAVGDKCGEVKFSTCGTDGMSRVGAANPMLAGHALLREILVPMSTLDQFCRHRNVTPDWLFLDIEGYEVAALRGAMELIARRGAALQIAVELHPASWAASGASRDGLLALLQQLHRSAMRPDGRPSSADCHETVFLEPLP
jgi:FkbM family methyltransferase